MQVGFAIGKFAFSDNPFSEAIEIGANLLVGSGGAAAAKQAFNAARRFGLVNTAVSAITRRVRDSGLLTLAEEGALPFQVRTGIARFAGSFREVFEEGAAQTGELIAKTTVDSAEVSAVLEQGNAFLRNAVRVGTDIAGASGLAQSVGAFTSAVSSFVGEVSAANEEEARVNRERALAFFTSRIDDDSGGSTVTLTDPLVLDIDADGETASSLALWLSNHTSRRHTTPLHARYHRDLATSALVSLLIFAVVRHCAHLSQAFR